MKRDILDIAQEYEREIGKHRSEWTNADIDSFSRRLAHIRRREKSWQPRSSAQHAERQDSQSTA